MDELRIECGLMAITAEMFDKEFLDLTIGEFIPQDFQTIMLDKEQATQLRDWLNEALEGMG